MRLSELRLPITIEYIRHLDNRGALTATVCIVERKGRNALTKDGDWLWWPTVTRYGEPRVVSNELETQALSGEVGE